MQDATSLRELHERILQDLPAEFCASHGEKEEFHPLGSAKAILVNVLGWFLEHDRMVLRRWGTAN